MRPQTPEGWQAVDAAYAAVKAFPPRDQVTATTWAVVAVLSAMREKSKDVSEARTAFNPDAKERFHRQAATGSRQGHQKLRSGPNPKGTFLVRWRSCGRALLNPDNLGVSWRHGGSRISLWG
jgi:hypothetical protein